MITEQLFHSFELKAICSFSLIVDQPPPSSPEVWIVLDSGIH